MHDQAFIDAILADPVSTIADYYASCLAGNPRALEFIADELGLSPEQAAARRIGVSDRSLGKRLPHQRIKAGRQVRDVLKGVGLYKVNGHEALRGCVTEPVIDDAGRTVGIRGYRLDPHAAGERVTIVGADAGSEDTAAAASEPPNAETVDESKSHTDEPSPPTDPPSSNDDLAIEDNQIVFRRDDRRYRVRGFERNTSTCQLKVSLMASRDGLVHLDSLDLVKARSRRSFIKSAATELYVDEDLVKKDIGQLLLKLETLQAQRIEELKRPRRAEVTLTDHERTEALALLRDPNLLDRIVADLDACGIVGERTNKLAGYLAAVSRKLPQPLALVIQSSSSAGKTSLMDAILAMVPDEDQLRLTGLSGQSLYYLEDDSLRHKILAVSEDEGISESAYALKLLQSEGALRHATVGKGEQGRMTTHQYTVEGPVGLFLTTTAVELDEELMNRCLVLSVDESREQTRAIHRRQRLAHTLEGKRAAARAVEVRKLHQNAQRLLRSFEVVNPHADQLTFPDTRTRLRRDYAKYLTLIRAVALLHQHQRPIENYLSGSRRIEYIRVVPRDIAIANHLASEILGRSLDELSPQTRCFLIELQRFVGDACRRQQIHRCEFRFTRRMVREVGGWSDFQVHKHLTRLTELEYVLVHRGKRGRQYEYELLWRGQGLEGEPFLTGLANAAALAEPASTTASSSPPEASSSTAFAPNSPRPGTA